MYQVSQKYKDSMKKPIRNRSYMVVALGLINQEAQRSAEVSDQDNFISYSDFGAIFDANWNGSSYATYEQDFFKADGSMVFLPKNSSSYKKNGLISINLFSGSFAIKFVFGCGKADIKGLSIQFGENYPTAFTITTDSGDATSFVSDSNYFETDAIFLNTSSLTIIITSMLVPNNRVRLYNIKFGLGLEYDNEWIKNAESSSTLSIINDDLPQVDFSVTLKNNNQIFNVDNPGSVINFLESGQRMHVMIGYELDDGSVEWLQMHSMYVSEWSSDDTQAVIKAIDRFQLMSDSYYKGKYYDDGISLYDLAELVFEDAGIGSDEYYIDSYLKNIKVKNPMPNVGHKEALQIIANAGRCVLSYDRYGRINIHSAFIPEFTTTSNGVSDSSSVTSIDIDTEKNDYATYEKDYWKTDGNMLFLPRTEVANCGYISSQISGDDCVFAENPIITRVLESKYKCFGLFIKFQKNIVSDFVVRTYTDGALADTLYISGNKLEKFEISYEFPEFGMMEIEFIKTSAPNSRVKIDYISLGAETDYRITYDDLYNTPTGTQLEKIKNLKVIRTMFAKSAKQEELMTDTVIYDGDNLFYYFSYPCYGYTAIVEGGGVVAIASSGSYYVEVEFSGVAVGMEVKVSIQGYKYNESTTYYTKRISNRGNDMEWNNPLISDAEHAKKVAEWLANYYSSPVEYELDFRGEPALDVGDVIFQENRYNDKLKADIEELRLKFEKSIRGSLKTRRRESVDRTQNRLVGDRLF